MQLPPPDAILSNVYKAFEECCPIKLFQNKHNVKHIQNKVLTHNSKGFTLAEVLIALVVIGIVAAITIPQMIVKHQKEQTVVQLKKVYSELAQAINMSKTSNGDFSDWDYSLSPYEFFNKYLSPYLKTSVSTVGEVKSKYKIKYLRLNGSEETSYNPLTNGAKIFTLQSGAQVLCSTNNPTSSRWRTGCTIDINGVKKPNKFGRDLFVFGIYSNKGIRPKETDDEDNSYKSKTREQLKNGPSPYSYQCNKNARGMWCAALIMADGWQIKNDYPW